MMSGARASSQGGKLFSLLLIYYWAVQYAQVSGEVGERGNLIYYLLIVPICLFIVLSFFRIMSSGQPLNRPAAIVLTFEIIVLSVALLRGDFQTVLTLGLLCTTIVVILTMGDGPSPSLLNKLFLASIPLIIIAYEAGRSNYTVGPGGLDAVWWRVAIFPQVATSAFFSGIIFLINVIYPHARFRKTCLALSLYFLLFSGLRSAIIAAALSFIYLMLRRQELLRAMSAKMLYMMTMIIAFILILLSPEILIALSTPDSPLNFVLFRSNEVVQDKEAVIQTIFRTLLWREHFRIVQDNWLFGIGTFDFTALSPDIGHLTTGSESFLTGTYARVGIPVILLVAGFLSAIRYGLTRNRDVAMIVGIMLAVAMLSYGGFIAAYDFTFLTMLGLLAGVLRPRRHSAASPPEPDARTTT